MKASGQDRAAIGRRVRPPYGSGAPLFQRGVAGLALALVALAGCARGDAGNASGGATRASAGAVAPAAGAAAAQRPAVRIVEVMADPQGVDDERGEWIRVRNAGAAAVDLRGWTLLSGGDAPHRIARPVAIAPGADVVLARDPSGVRGVRAAYGYGRGLALGNTGDWIALRDARGATVDSVAWGKAPRGTAIRREPPAEGTAPAASTAVAGTTTAPGAPGGAPSSGSGTPAMGAAAGGKALTVRVLDVGQGDAIYAENGGSRVLIDGGPDLQSMARQIDRLGLDGQTIDVVIVTHPHIDHYNGLRELLKSRRRIRVRFFFEAGDPSPNRTLAELRDSVFARARRGELEYRDADDPCGDGRAECTITLRGGALLHIYRPYPGGQGDANERSVPVKLVGPDSASFTMWLAGDAEHEAIDWMMRQSYPMRARVMKLDHHGSCNGITAAYLRRVAPELAVASLDAHNEYGHMHTQTLRLLEAQHVPWLRTDQNGTITLTTPGTPGGGWSAHVERGERDARGPSDRASTQGKCD